MKKTLLTIVGIIAIATNLFGQANIQGNIIVDPYYGFPNFGKSFYKSIENSSSTSNYKATGMGPAGIRAEYMVSDKVGVGLDFIYNSNRISYTDTQHDTTWTSVSTYTVATTTNNAERLMQRIRLQARFNFHFDISNPNLDGYFGVGVGTNNRFRKYWLNGVEVNDVYTSALSNLTLIPVSLRICTGLRYYFNPNVGMNMEMGLGGPLLSAGVSVKIQ